MRLARLQEFLTGKKITFTYAENDGLGSIDFLHRGLSYHIWEFLDGEYGVESNVANAGKTQDYLGDYEAAIMAVMEDW